MKLHRLTQSKLDDYKLRSNFTEDEEITFDMLSKGKSINEIATRLSVSTRTVDRRIADIKSKNQPTINSPLVFIMLGDFYNIF